jgi:hypothetical protein
LAAAAAGSLIKSNSVDDTPIIVRARLSRPAAGLAGERPGSKPALVNGDAAAGEACGGSCAGAGAWLGVVLCVGGSTLNVVPHFGHRIFKPFSGTRRSST